MGRRRGRKWKGRTGNDGVGDGGRMGGREKDGEGGGVAAWEKREEMKWKDMGV